MQVLAGISAPGALSHQFSKQDLRSKEVWLTHVNWETADYLCTNPKCRHVTNGYGNYVTRLSDENKALREEIAKYKDTQNPTWIKWCEELQAENQLLRELVREAGEAFEAASDGDGVNFHAYALDMKAALQEKDK
jgi:hypothetical protein